VREWQIRHGRLPNPGARPVSPTSPALPPALQLGRSRAESPTLCGPQRRHRPPTRGQGPLPPDVGERYTTKRIVVIGIHGGSIMCTLLDEPPGTSPKFASMMKEAIEMLLRAK